MIRPIPATKLAGNAATRPAAARRCQPSRIVDRPVLVPGPSPRPVMPAVVAEAALRMLARWVVRTQAADRRVGETTREESPVSAPEAPVSPRVLLEIRAPEGA